MITPPQSQQKLVLRSLSYTSFAMSDITSRPPTPQVMLHRLPNKSNLSSNRNEKPSKYIILIIASTAVAGKVQIAQSVSSALSCPLFQGDSLHETSSKAASVGASERLTWADGDEQAAASVPNEARYQRLWLSKMTRTGLLFPEESRPANEEFSGFCGALSTSTSRRGSSSSVTSASSSSDAALSTPSMASSFVSSRVPATKYINKPLISTLPEDKELRKVNPALMVVTHPDIEKWHKDSIRKAVGEYHIGVIFIPLSEDEELPVLKPLDPKTMMSFVSFGSFDTTPEAEGAPLDQEIVLKVNTAAKVEDLIEDIIDGVREIMNT